MFLFIFTTILLAAVIATSLACKLLGKEREIALLEKEREKSSRKELTRTSPLPGRIAVGRGSAGRSSAANSTEGIEGIIFGLGSKEPPRRSTTPMNNGGDLRGLR